MYASHRFNICLKRKIRVMRETGDDFAALHHFKNEQNGRKCCLGIYEGGSQCLSSGLINYCCSCSRYIRLYCVRLPVALAVYISQWELPMRFMMLNLMRCTFEISLIPFTNKLFFRQISSAQIVGVLRAIPTAQQISLMFLILGSLTAV